MNGTTTAGSLSFKALSARPVDRWTQVAIAAALLTSQQNVQRWQAGIVRPNALFRRKIAGLFGIAEDDWLTPGEAKFLLAQGGAPPSTSARAAIAECSTVAAGVGR